MSMSEPITGLLGELDRDHLDIEGLDELGLRVDRWLDAHDDALASLRAPEPDSERRGDEARQLPAATYEGGWAQCGWPATIGGTGGSILERAVIFERLTKRGYTTLAMFEHIEILLPTLVRYADPDFLAIAGPEFLSGQGAWS